MFKRAKRTAQNEKLLKDLFRSGDSRLPLPVEALRYWATHRPDDIYLSQPVNRTFRHYSYAEVYETTLKMANALKGLGLAPGAKVSILSKNCVEWFMADWAIQAAGLVSTPIFPTASAEMMRYVLEHSETEAIFIGKLDNLEDVSKGIPDNLLRIGFPYETLPCAHHWNALCETTAPLDEADLPQPDYDGLCSIVYTSGSSGEPKGVMLSWRNICSGAYTTLHSLKVLPSDRTVSYLPLAHITERVVVQQTSLYAGLRVGFVESLPTFTQDLQYIEPTLFLSVPRLWAKFKMGVLAKVPEKKLEKLLRIPVLSSIVKRKIRRGLGLHKTRLFGCGSAPIAPSLLKWYHSIGIHVAEGWGMTETSGLASCQFPFRAEKIGTVGRILNGYEAKISEEGELLIRGDAVINGYYKDQKLTDSTIKDGWFHTGDQAEIDAEGALRITGRLKEIFKTAKGKYVVPAVLEARLSENAFIEQACVMGAGLPDPIAVVNLSSDMIKNCDWREIQAGLLNTLRHINESVMSHEKLACVMVAKDIWSIENGLLTPTLKLKRARLEKYYETLMNENSFAEAVMWEHSPMDVLKKYMAVS